MLAIPAAGGAKRSCGGLWPGSSRNLGSSNSQLGLGHSSEAYRRAQRPAAAAAVATAAQASPPTGGRERQGSGKAHAFSSSSSSSSNLVGRFCSTQAAIFLLHSRGIGTATSLSCCSRCGTHARPLPRRRVLAVNASWPSLGAHRRAEPGRLFIFGLGYTGLGAAAYFQQRGWAVAGTCRSLEKRRQLDARGLTAFHFDPADSCYLDGKALERLRQATHVLSTVPPEASRGGEQDPVVQAHAQQLCERAADYQWVGYVSSTSVYGDYEGEWVDERSELRAAGGKGWSRVVAEHEWLALHDSFGLPAHIFRCGGIYGPRRSAIDTVQRQEAAGRWQPSASQERRAAQRFTARCHVYDICQVLEASMRRPAPGQAYNIADDDPADRSTVMRYAAELLQRRADGQPMASWDEPLLSSGWGWGDGKGEQLGGKGVSGAISARSSGSDSSGEDAADVAALAAARGLGRGDTRSRSRAAVSSSAQRLEEKRVRNQRIKEELGVQLQFPTYREGLAAIAEGDVRPFE